jgi:hypothetical protein
MQPNIMRASVTVVGIKPLIQNAFTPDAIPLPGKKRERAGTAGNDPTEWQRSCMLTKDRVLYITNIIVFATILNGAKNTKKGRGSIQPLVASTLQVEEEVIPLVNRTCPERPTYDKHELVYIDVCGVTNPGSRGGRHVRYRLTAAAGWECSFTLRWDKSLIGRDVMEMILIDAGTLAGFCDGRKYGFGRFEIKSFAVHE